MGNWNGSKSAYQAKVAGTTTLIQNRTHNTVNEITNITESTGTAWPTPGYDAAGNMTSGPQPLSPANRYVLTYDAWNRLVWLKNGNMVVAAYAYDGASRRTTKTVGSATRHYYYDDRWRVVEERLNTAITADRRFVWGIQRLDDLILRDQIFGQTMTRLYAMDDKINVTAVVDVTGTVRERYGYNGFGGVNYMNANFVTIPVSAFDWETLFYSYRYDTESGFYQVRYRYLHPLLGRWLSRDPLGELGFETLRNGRLIILGDGPNAYLFVDNDPINNFDLNGLATLEECDEQYDADIAICRTLRTRRQRALCYSRAFAFYATCIGEASVESAAQWCAKHPRSCIILCGIIIIIIPKPIPIPA